MTANVTITTAERDDVVRVPTRALRFRPPAGRQRRGRAPSPVGDAPGRRHARVAVLDGGDARVRVRSRPASPTTASREITGGLDEGDRVIIAWRATARPCGAPRPPLPRCRGGGAAALT